MINFPEKYDLWFKVKTKLNLLINRPQFKSREVWWCSIGENIGDEENGKGDKFLRPVLVVRKFNNRILLALPMTTQVKSNPYYYNFNFKGKEQCLMLSQLRLIDAKRLQYLMGKVTSEDFYKIKLAISKIVLELDLTQPHKEAGRA